MNREEEPEQQVQPAHPLAAEVKRYLANFPTLRESLDREWQRYCVHAVSADEVRAELDEALAGRTLTEELYKMRGK